MVQSFEVSGLQLRVDDGTELKGSVACLLSAIPTFCYVRTETTFAVHMLRVLIRAQRAFLANNESNLLSNQPQAVTVRSTYTVFLCALLDLAGLPPNDGGDGRPLLFPCGDLRRDVLISTLQAVSFLHICMLSNSVFVPWQ